MARHLHKTLIDYLVIAISPALIIALVTSLVHFLALVFYRGGFSGHLLYILTLFVIGAVLTARISIEEGQERAILFAVPLGIVTLMAINKYVAFQGQLASLSFFINFGLIALIWWSADRLTWDCTLIDDQEEDSGEGLLETIGLDRPDRSAMQREIEPMAVEIEATTSRDDRPQGWWEQFVERRRRPHAPGVWVIYFSLAALPLFGIGQLLIPADSLMTRQYAFTLLVAYTASGLGLLLSTSFLGLRRYLRHRHQEMPIAMVGLWLVIGAMLIVGVMITAMLLPRPNAEYAVSELPFQVGSPSLKPSRRSVGNEGIRQKQPDARRERSDEKPDETKSGDKPGKAASQDQEKSTDNKSDAQKSDSKNAENRSDAQKNPDSKSQNAGSASSGDDKAKSPGNPENKQDSTTATDKATRDRTDDHGNKSSDTSDAQSPDSEERRTEQESHGTAENQPLRAFELPNLNQAVPLTASLLNFLKSFVYLVLAALVAYAAWANRESIVAALVNFQHLLADFWASLFGRTSQHSDATTEAAAVVRLPQRHFADYTDPFASGIAARYTPNELVQYTFEALEAWARDHDCPRHPEQTPHEFARCLATNVPPAIEDAPRLAELYCQAAYAPGTLRPASVTSLSQLWQQMARPS